MNVVDSITRGWCYSYSLLYDFERETKKESCTYHPLTATNLDGVFDYLNSNQTTRTIVLCRMNNVEECIKPKYHEQNCGKSCIIGWEYKNITTLKLRTTKMWLRKKN